MDHVDRFLATIARGEVDLAALLVAADADAALGKMKVVDALAAFCVR